MLGPIGFDRRRDYAAIGPVTNLASRLCAEATAGQVLVTNRVCAAVEGLVDGQPLGPRLLKGSSRQCRSTTSARRPGWCRAATKNEK
jgi:adenylate cyclase